MNVATIFPLWPGNIGLLQAAVALPLVQYGVAYGTGFAYGLVLQAIEMSVGVGVGLVMLAREGLSFAALKRIEDEEEQEAEALVDEPELEPEPEPEPEPRARESRAGCSQRVAPGAERAEARRDHRVGRRRARSVARDRRDERLALERDELDVRHRGHGRRARHVAQERDLAERLAGAEAAPEDRDLARLDHVEAIAGVALAQDHRAGREGHGGRLAREPFEHGLGEPGEHRHAVAAGRLRSVPTSRRRAPAGVAG